MTAPCSYLGSAISPYRVLAMSLDKIEFLCQKAQQAISQRDWDKAKVVYISAWNEWTEDHCLLPDTIWGYSYLEALRRALR